MLLDADSVEKSKKVAEYFRRYGLSKKEKKVENGYLTLEAV